MHTVTLAWSDAALDIADALAELDATVYAVGGMVRDAILRRPSDDLDLVTPDGGMRVARRLANAIGGAYYALDESRDVGRVVVDRSDGRLTIDVSGFRGADLTADLSDRDFTLNAMAVNLTGDTSLLIDPLNGAADLLAKRLRLCRPDALERDPVRALRGVRQSVQFGLRIDPEALRAIKAIGPRLTETSPERVRDEWFRLLSLDKAPTAIRIADAVGLTGVIVPEVTPLHGLVQGRSHVYDGWGHSLAVTEAMNDLLHTISRKRTDDSAAQFNLGMIVMAFDLFRIPLLAHLERENADGRSHRALLLMTALLHDCGKAIVEWRLDDEGDRRYPGHAEAGAEQVYARMTALRMSGDERRIAAHLTRLHMDQTIWQEVLHPIDIYHFWRSTGPEGVDLLFLCMADYLGVVGHAYDQARWLRLVENAQLLLHGWFNDRARLVDPPPLLDGNDLMRALDIRPGPIVGTLLELIREGQITGTVTTRDEAIATARAGLPGQRE